MAETNDCLALHQHRAGAARRLALIHDAQTLGDLGIGLQEATQIAAEPVLVELVAGLDVPQPARVGRNLVGHDDPHHIVFPQPPGFQLEIDQPDADAKENAGEEIIDPDGKRHDVVDFLRGRPSEGGDVLFRHHRMIERSVLVIKLDDRAWQLGAFVDSKPGRQGTGGDIAHHNLKRDDYDLADQLPAHVEPADKVRRHPDIVEMLEDVFGNPVVENALALDNFVLFGVEGGGVVLEVLNQRSRLRAFIKDLRLALVNPAAATHRGVQWVFKIHGMPWLLFASSARSAAAGPDI